MLFNFWTHDLSKSKVALDTKINNPCIRGGSKNQHFFENNKTTQGLLLYSFGQTFYTPFMQLVHFFNPCSTYLEENCFG